MACYVTLQCYICLYIFTTVHTNSQFAFNKWGYVNPKCFPYHSQPGYAVFLDWPHTNLNMTPWGHPMTRTIIVKWHSSNGFCSTAGEPVTNVRILTVFSWQVSLWQNNIKTTQWYIYRETRHTVAVTNSWPNFHHNSYHHGLPEHQFIQTIQNPSPLCTWQNSAAKSRIYIDIPCLRPCDVRNWSGYEVCFNLPLPARVEVNPFPVLTPAPRAMTDAFTHPCHAQGLPPPPPTHL